MISPFAVVVGLAFAATIGLVLVLVRKRPNQPWSDLLTTRTAIVAVLVVASGAFAVQGMDGALRHDEAVFVVTNFEVANGNLPYTAAFDNTGPLGPWFGGVGVALGRLVGLNAVSSARLAYFPVALIAVMATFFLGLRLRLSTLAAAMGALALVAVPSFSREALSGPRPKLLVVALLVLYLISLHDRRYALSGALLALATLTWQSSFVLVLVPVIAAIWTRPPERALRSAARFAAGGLFFVVLVVVVYAIAGQFQALVEGFVTWNVGLGSSRLPTSLFEAIVNPLKDLWGGHQATWPLLVVGGLAVLPFTRGLFTVRNSTSTPDRPDALDLVTVAFAVLTAWTLIDYQGVVDLFPLLPLAAIGVARVADHIRLRSFHWSIALLTMLLIAGSIDLARTRSTELREQRADLEALVGTGCVASYGDPVALAIVGQSNPHRFFFMVPGLDEYLGPQAVDYVDVLLASRPEYVGGSTSLEGGNLGLAVSEALPRAGYQAVSTAWFEGWLHQDADASELSSCTTTSTSSN